MVALESLESYLLTWNGSIDVTQLVLALVLAAVLSYILSWVYVKYGTSLSNRQKFANNFVLLTTTTTLIITIVRSSLALSLGLVGALSIVRFRAAIKEPEELGFLFLTIAIGLGLGANQFLVTVVGFGIITLLIFLRCFNKKGEDRANLLITGKFDLKTVTKVLNKYCSSVALRRLDSGKENEASFFVSVNPNKLDKIQQDLGKLKISYLDAQ